MNSKGILVIRNANGVACNEKCGLMYAMNRFSASYNSGKITSVGAVSEKFRKH